MSDDHSQWNKKARAVSIILVKKPFRIVLPMLVGAISTPLIAWDIHNQHVIASVGMGWDTGAPVWPYQTPDILLRFFSFPAYIVAMPIANWLKLWLHVGASYFATAPLIFGWWWLIGFLLDRGLVKQSQTGSRFLFSILVIFCLALSCVAVMVLVDSLRWWSRYGSYFGLATTSLMMMRFLTPAIWSVIVGTFVGIAARKAVSKNPSKNVSMSQ